MNVKVNLLVQLPIATTCGALSDRHLLPLWRQSQNRIQRAAPNGANLGPPGPVCWPVLLFLLSRWRLASAPVARPALPSDLPTPSVALPPWAPQKLSVGLPAVSHAVLCPVQPSCCRRQPRRPPFQEPCAPPWLRPPPRPLCSGKPR